METVATASHHSGMITMQHLRKVLHNLDICFRSENKLNRKISEIGLLLILNVPRN